MDVMALIVGPVLQEGHITLVSFVVHIHRYDRKLFQFCVYLCLGSIWREGGREMPLIH